MCIVCVFFGGHRRRQMTVEPTHTLQHQSVAYSLSKKEERERFYKELLLFNF